MKTLKIVGVILMVLFIAGNILADDDPNLSRLQNFQAPTVSTFNTYGAIPVSFYTGTPEISIPLYSIKENGIEIPITLNYNTNNVKPNTHPGTTGLGWNLFAGGCITRIIKGLNDEKTMGYAPHTLLGFLGREDILSDNWWKKYSDNYQNTPWYSKNRLLVDAALDNTMNDILNSHQDISPDKFIFNFLGYSGTFYRNHKGCWIVDSKTKFKIEHKIIKYSEARDQITHTMSSKNFGLLQTDAISNNTIEKFTLIAPDGVIFEFGGKNAIDYSLRLFDRGNVKNLPIATTWHLSKITLPNGKKYTFDYIVPGTIIDGNFDFWIQSNFDAPLTGRGLSFQLIMPVLLNKIISPDSVNLLELNYKNSTELKYDDTYFNEQGNFQAIDIWFSTFMDTTYYTRYKQIKWKQLETVKIADSTQFIFSYTNDTTQRLKLLSLTKSANKKELEKYTFSYYDQKLPKYISGHYDHLGFYNGADFSFTFMPDFYFDKLIIKGATNVSINPNAILEMTNNANLFYEKRKGDPTGVYVTAEMLKTIKYPAGGYTKFEYEPNIIDSMVNLERNKVVYSNLSSPGGLRISRIINYQSDNTFINSKHYYYTRNFKLKNTTGSNISSGILAFTPKYYWDTNLEDNQPTSQAASNYLKILTSGSTNQAFNNLDESSYIGYSEVVESNEDSSGNSKGYTKYKYTNFGTGFFDDPPIVSLQSEKSSSGIFLSPYTPFSSNSKKRGNLLSKQVYDNDDKLLREESYKYVILNRDTIRNIAIFQTLSEHGQRLYNSYGGANCYPLGGSYYTWIYDYLPIEKTEKQVFLQDTVKTVTKYEYNQENQIKSEKIFTDDTNFQEKKTIYSGDIFRLNNDPGSAEMFTKMEIQNIYTLPIEITLSNNKGIIAGTLNKYKYKTYNNTNVFYNSQIYKLKANQPLSDFKPVSMKNDSLILDSRYKTQTVFNVFNEYGYPEYVETNAMKTVYLWGYNYRYPIAQIKNSTYNEVKSALGVDPCTIAKSNDPDISKIEALKKKLPKSQISIFSYKPFVGVVYSSNTRSSKNFYNYDFANRLAVVRDRIGNITSEYKYLYAGGVETPITESSTFTSSLTGNSNILVGRTDSLFVSTTGGSGAFLYNWSLSDSNGAILVTLTNSSKSQFKYTYSTKDIYTLTCLVKDISSGKTQKLTKVIDVDYIQGGISLYTSNLVSQTNALIVSVTSLSNSFTYDYSCKNSAGTIVLSSVNSTSSAYSFSLSSAGTYTVYCTINDKGTGKTRTYSKTLNVFNKLASLSVSGTTTYSKGATGGLSATVSGGSGSYSYSWSASNSNISLNISSIPYVSFLCKSTGTTDLTIKVQDNITGSTLSLTKTITIQ